MLWSGNAGRFLVARDNQVCLLQLTEGTWKVIPYPQRFGGDSHITSLIHYPQGADSLRPFAATLANGWVVNFGFPSVQAYDKRLQTQGINFRMATDTAGNLLATWSADGKLRVTIRISDLETAPAYRMPNQITAEGRTVPIQPIDLQFARQKDLIVLHGEVEGKGIVALFSRRSNHLVAKIGVEDPIEMEIRGTDLWVLDRQGRLNQFHQFEKNF
jgi:hypothetical protein